MRARDNLEIRTGADVARIAITDNRTSGVVLADGEEISADEVVVTAGALWTPTLLLRSGIGPKDHLADYDIKVHADLPVGSNHERPFGGPLFSTGMTARAMAYRDRRRLFVSEHRMAPMWIITLCRFRSTTPRKSH